MPYTKTTYTLIQNVGETDSDFMDRVNAFIALELFYFESVGGSFPVPKEDSNASYKGSPPTQPTSDTTYWDVTNTQNRRVVTFSYDNLYYWIYTGATPPLPGPPSPAPSGNIVMWGPGSTLTDGVLTLNTLAPNFTNLAPATVAGEAVEFSQFGSLALGTQLTGLGAGTNTPITATDTILSAFQNLQAQISAGGSAITALTGDVTATGPGSVAATIANNAVTFAKFQNLSGPGVLTGRYSAGSGNMQEITLGSGISMSGAGVLSATGTGGTVTSVGLSLPGEFSVSGSPVTGSGILSATWANATAGYVFAGPSGAVPPGTPSFRALVASDIPALPYASSSLTDSYFYVGNGSNVATGVAMSGEATLANTGAVTLSNSAIIGKVLTGYTSGSGTVAATDTILQAIQKLDGNDGLRVLKAGDTMSGLLQFSGTGHAGIQLNSLTTAQRTALTPAAGMIVFDSSINAVCRYNGTIWEYEMYARVSGSNVTTTSNAAGNITGLSVSVEANAVYAVHGYYQVSCDNTGGVKFTQTGPAGATHEFMYDGVIAATNTTRRDRSVVSGTLTANANNTAAITSGLIVIGNIRTGANAGTLQMQFASGTNTQTSTVSIGSWIRVTRIG